MKTSAIVLAAIGISFTEALMHKPGSTVHQKMIRKEKQQVQDIQERIKAEGDLDPQEKYFSATIDHFDNHGAGSPTYQMRYLVDTTYYDETNGPIIFYAGNEGDIWTFFENSGFMSTTLAEQFGAMTIWGEHRYFGKSMPFGDDSFEKPNLAYLTVEQAMNDYVDLIKEIKFTEGL